MEVTMPNHCTNEIYFNFKTVEEKWQNYWQKNKSFKTELNKNKKN